MTALDESSNGQVVDVMVGDTVELTLAENPTTGYRWRLQKTGQPVAQLIEDRMVAQVTERSGAPSKRHWTFRVIAQGTAPIGMTLQRHWEQGLAKTFETVIAAS